MTQTQALPVRLDGEVLLWLWRDVFSPGEATRLQHAICRQLPWEQPLLRIFGQDHPTPRLTCWCGDAGYRYSGRHFAPHPWTDELRQARDLAERLTGQCYNSVLANLYRNGLDHMGWHADDEAELGPAPWIASLSLGAARDFCLGRKGANRIVLRLALPHNSLLLMAPALQRHWQHALPVRKRVDAARLNLTFRLINHQMPSRF